MDLVVLGVTNTSSIGNTQHKSQCFSRAHPYYHGLCMYRATMDGYTVRLYEMLLYSTVQYSTVQYGTVLNTRQKSSD